MVKMASKKVVTLKGFETKPGEPWRAADDYNDVTDAHKKLLAGFLEEALTGENHVNTYTKKRSVTIEQCVALSVDLEMAGVEGAADVVVDNAATLKTRMTALKQLLLGDVDTDEEADDDEVQTVGWLDSSLVAPAQKHSVLLLDTGNIDVAVHREALGVLRKELIGARSLTLPAVKSTIKEWLEKHKDAADDNALWQAVDKQKDAAAAPARAAWSRVLMAAAKRALAATKKKKDPTGAGKAALKCTGDNKGKKNVPLSPGPETLPTKLVAKLEGDVAALTEHVGYLVNDVESIDVAKARKRAKMKSELARIKEGFKDRGFIKHEYRKKGGETLKPKLLAMWKTARAAS